MCIIAASAAGIPIPSEATFKAMWRANPDGAGLMYPRKGKVVIEKGFMTFESYYGHIKDLPFDTTATPIVFHMRIATHGGITRKNTHPFPLTNKIKELESLDIKAKVGIAHNGIIPIDTTGTLSDTMCYIKDVAYPASRKDKAWYNNVSADSIGGSRLCILDSKGNINYVGSWYTSEEGIMYSHYMRELDSYYNSSYKDWYDDSYYDDSYKAYKGYTEDVPLYQLTEGYVITDRRIIDVEYDVGEYFIDAEGRVYTYDYVCDVCYPIEGQAIDHNVTPIRYNDNEAYYMEVIA